MIKRTMLLFASLTAACDGHWYSPNDAVTALGGESTGSTSSGDADTDDDADSSVVSCDTDPSVNHMVDGGATVSGALGQVVGVIVMADPARPALDNNAWTLRLTDSSGTPLVGATLVATAKMPAHGHFSPILPSSTANADGSYTVSPLYFFMPGVWQVAIAVGQSDGGAPLDTLIFRFCIGQ